MMPEKHCGNCEYCNLYKEVEPCNDCKKLSNWKLVQYVDTRPRKDFDKWEEKKKLDTHKMKIILIAGKAHHGKDSTANMLKEKLEKQGKTVLIAHYGDLVKYVCKTFFGWNGEKDEQGRTLLQEVGTDKIRAKYPDFWVEFVKDILEIFNDKWDYVIIPDTRFPNEIDVMKNSFNNVTSICVVRTNFISPLTDEQRKHKSETALDNYIFDCYFVGEDLEMLERKIDIFLKGFDGLCK